MLRVWFEFKVILFTLTAVKDHNVIRAHINSEGQWYVCFQGTRWDFDVAPTGLLTADPAASLRIYLPPVQNHPIVICPGQPDGHS